MSLLEFDKVSYASDNNLIIKDLSIDIHLGDYMSIIGPSGSGKSTFLKLCSHLITTSSGKITFKGKNILNYDPIEIRKMITYCFQTPYLFGKTVIDNLSFPYKIRNKSIDMNRIKSLFSLFNIDKEFINKDINNLSGGEKQRIALIRSLIFKPEILLLDEVTSALDADNTKIVENVVNTLNKEGTTILWITHNLVQSKKNANKIMTIEEGKLKSVEVLK